MITKQKRNEILKRFENKDEKNVVANVIDKVYRYEKTNKLEYTNFLNIHEYEIISKILNELKVKYCTFPKDSGFNKKVVIFLPDFINEDYDVYSTIVTVIKIIPNSNVNLKHKDYMGALYNIGIKQEMIGDIICKEKYAYAFLISKVVDFVKLNLLKVGNQIVSIEIMNLNEIDYTKLKNSFKEKECIVSSLRCDAVLASVYSLSRAQVKEKVLQGDLYVNDKCEYFASNTIKDNDVVSFRKCGKFKVGEVLRITKSGNIVINVKIFV